MKIICFGDSNTYGFDPCSFFGGRYSSEDRWVDLLAQISGWDVNNAGMNGRAIPQNQICFPSDTDCILIMLGTNDLLQGNTPCAVALRMERFLGTLQKIHDKLIIVSPPKLQRGEWVNDERLICSSDALSSELESLCERLGIRFINSTDWDLSMCFDGVHLTEEANHHFANEIYREMMKFYG